VEENGRPVNQTSTKTAEDAISMHNIRKVGLGVTAAGASGLAGINLEFHFSPDTAFLTGVGIASGFQTFKIQLKKYLTGTWFLPYMSVGYARWYSVGEDNKNIKTSTPSFLAKRFLNDTEKRTGQFAENLIYPSLGLKYMQLTGEWAGVSAHAEVILLMDIDDLVVAPTGEIGMTYFF